VEGGDGSGVMSANQSTGMLSASLTLGAGVLILLCLLLLRCHQTRGGALSTASHHRSRDQHTRRVAKRGAMKLTSREEMMDDDDRVLTDMGLQIEESWAEEGIEDELPTAAANPNAVLDAEALIPEPSPCTFATAGANGNPTRSGGNEHEAMDWVLGYSAKPA